MSMFCNVMMSLLLYAHVCVTRTGWKTRPRPKRERETRVETEIQPAEPDRHYRQAQQLRAIRRKEMKPPRPILISQSFI